MPIGRPLIPLLLLGAAARAQLLKPLIDRPITLPRSTVELTLHGTYANWDSSALTGGMGSLDGETVALGVDYGANDQIELGLSTVFPVNPGAAFGSIVGSASIAVDPRAAVRLDVGYENYGLNGDVPGGVDTHVSRFMMGIGAPAKIPLSPTIAFVTGRTGAVDFGHFRNLGENGVGLYLGSSFFTEGASDFFVFSKGDSGSSTNFGINLPLGLLLQPDPHVAITLQAGYSAAISVPDTGSAVALHFIPVALEAVVTPVAALDIGFRFFVDGYVAETGGGGGGGPGYFDLRALMLWFRMRT